MPVARNTAMIAVSRRCAKLRPAQACSSRLSSWRVKTGTSFWLTRGGCRPALGAGRWAFGAHLLSDARRLQPGHRVGQLVFGGQPPEELLQGAVLVAGVGAAVAVQQP